MLPSVKVIFVAIGNFLLCCLDIYLYDFCGNIRNYLEDWMLFQHCEIYQYAWVGGMRSIHIYFGSSTMPDCGNCRLSKSPSSISCEIELPSESLAMHILYHYHIYKPAFFFGGMKTQTHRIERLWWQLCRLEGLG